VFDELTCCVIDQVKMQCSVMHGTCVAEEKFHTTKCSVASPNNCRSSPCRLYWTQETSGMLQCHFLQLGVLCDNEFITESYLAYYFTRRDQ